MRKTQTLRQSAAASNEKRLESLADQIETVRQAKHQSAQELASTLEPLAQAMAALADETRQTLTEIDRKSREQAEKFSDQMAASAKSLKQATAAASQAAENLNQAGKKMELMHYGLCLGGGAVLPYLSPTA
jgi:membrane-bound lytic murein transglycosylase B